MTRERLQLLLGSALFSALGAGCGGAVQGATPSADAGAPTDAGTPTDAGSPVDASTPVDAGAPLDASSPIDASPPRDAASPVDAGSPATDAGPACAPIANTNMCEEGVTYPCGSPIGLADPNVPTREECKVLCAPALGGAELGPAGCYVMTGATPSGGDAATLRVGCASCAVGRRPADLVEGEPCAGEDPVAVALAEMARVEAASVHAFRRLAHTLTELGADADLVARARRAARDEIAHARLVARLAKARGVAPRRVEVDRAHTPTTFALALENAVEGCVHETLGVAYLAHQRLHAADPELRAMAEALYDDELDHAALSWDLVAFFALHLDAAEREVLALAQARALEAVSLEAKGLDPRVRERLGLPAPHVVAALVANLEPTLYAAA